MTFAMIIVVPTGTELIWKQNSTSLIKLKMT